MYGFNEKNKSQVRPDVWENIHTISVCVCVSVHMADTKMLFRSASSIIIVQGGTGRLSV